MRLETIRIVADWLGDGTYGVNAQLPGIPLDGTDPVPPAVVTILDETRHGPAARRHLTKDIATPALVLYMDRDLRLEGEVPTAHRDGEVSVAINYAEQESTTNLGIRHAYYTMRAVERSLRVLMSNAQVAARTRGSVCVIALREIVYPPIYAPIGDLIVTSGLLAVFTPVRDQAP